MKCSILFLVDCKWGEWVPSTCSKSCDGGVRNFSREKFPEHLGGKPCEGNLTYKKEECNMHKCPGKIASNVTTSPVPNLIMFFSIIK